MSEGIDICLKKNGMVDGGDMMVFTAMRYEI